MEKGKERECRDCEEEKEQIRAEHRKVLKSSVDFEKRIRNKWREKNRQKNERIAKLNERIEELERRLAEHRAD